jgi:hypothetical protein
MILLMKLNLFHDCRMDKFSISCQFILQRNLARCQPWNFDHTDLTPHHIGIHPFWTIFLDVYRFQASPTGSWSRGTHKFHGLHTPINPRSRTIACSISNRCHQPCPLTAPCFDRRCINTNPFAPFFFRHTHSFFAHQKQTGMGI